MAREELNKHYSDLISRYLSGNSSSAEVEELEAWVLAAPENKAQFIASKKAWMLSGLAKDTETVDIETAWQQTSKQLFEQTKVVEMKPRRNLSRWIGIAAAIIVLVVAALWILPDTTQEGPMIVQTTEESQAVDLPDGSQITLNQSARLEFAEVKEISKRVVQLEGDAFFEVERNENLPFVIQAKELEIEVLGTSFYVDARAGEEEVQVIVESGRVAVRYDTVEKILVANEKAIFNTSTQELSKEENTDENYLSVKTKTLIFTESTLAEVVFALNRQFHTNIRIGDPALNSCPLTSTFRDKSLQTILSVLEQSFGIQANQSGQDIVLTGVCGQGE